MIIVCDTAKGLLAASTIAANLVARRVVQGWNLSDEVAGLEVKFYPDNSNVAIERGGPEAYRNYVLTTFTTAGYKEYTEEPELVVVAPVEQEKEEEEV